MTDREVQPTGAFILEERARLAINCLSRNVDPGLGNAPYFEGSFVMDPPALFHHPYWDWSDCVGRTVAALVLARHMTGSELNAEVDEKLETLMLSFLGEKGLSWIPKSPYVDPVHKGKFAGRPEPPVAEFWGQRAYLMGLLTLYQRTHEERYRKHLDNLINGLWEIAIKKDGYCYYPQPPAGPQNNIEELIYTPAGWQSSEEPIGTGVMCSCGVILRPIVQYLMTGVRNETALKLCEGMSAYVVERANDFGPDGAFQGHFHSRVGTAAAILRYGLYADRPEFVEWAEAVYKYARTIGTSFEWFPEYVGKLGCETCCVTDMIDLAIMLAEAGRDECWDHAEAYGRNHLVESQFVDMEWMKRTPRFSQEKIHAMFENMDKRQYTRENVPEMLRGGFSGRSAPNDIVDPRLRHWRFGGAWMMTCCNAHGTHGLYLLWHHAVRQREEGIFVNLLFDRATLWADVRSGLPFEGKVVVTVHNACTLHIRIPAWAPREEVRVDSAGKEWAWRGNYIKIPNLSQNDAVTVSFPLPEREETVHVAGLGRTKAWDASPSAWEYLEDTYKIRWRGNTVVSIDPPGSAGPLYQRTVLKSQEEPSAPRAPHAPVQEIDW